MSAPILKQIQNALRNLNPNDVRQLAEQPFTVGLLAANEDGYQGMVQFLSPPELSPLKARQTGRHVLQVKQAADFDRCDFGLAEQEYDYPPHFYPFDPLDPGSLVSLILDRHEDLWIPLARHFIPFRDAVIDRLIRKIAQENAFFAVATALPNIAPSLLELPWVVGEFASDTAFLTINQVRLAFLIAASSDAPVGYIGQRGQIASIIASAFGWRALARELVSKIPFGGGLVPKALVAFAGTYVVGLGLESYMRLGRSLTAQEKRRQYTRALAQGRAIVEAIADRWKARNSLGAGV